MPKIGEMIESNYLKKSDVDDEAIVTIVGVKKANIAREDQDADYKWLIKFKEFEKPMVLNSTNIQLLARACGSDDSDDWKDKQVILYVDENVTFAGQLVGGLRIKAKKGQKKKAAASQDWEDSDKTAPVTADEIPF